VIGVMIVHHDADHGGRGHGDAAVLRAALLLGLAMTLPIGGADMPVVISLYNALTGLAVAFEGFVLGNAAMIIAGTVVGAAGTLLTQLMAKAMNRSLGERAVRRLRRERRRGERPVTGSMKAIDASDAAVMMAFAQKVIIVPGYGMAVAQAQHKVWELCQLLIERRRQVKFAIHPVAGRMPGHMNVLLAEAGVPYDLIYDLDEINAEFDIGRRRARHRRQRRREPGRAHRQVSPIYGMPILNADKAKNVIVIKRGQRRIGLLRHRERPVLRSTTRACSTATGTGRPTSAAGARVVITSSSDAKLARARELGAHETINYVQTPDWEKDVLRLTGGGADLVLEVGGSKTVAKSIASVKPGGSVIVIGAVSGPGAAVEPMSLIAGSVRLQGVYVGSRQMHEDLARFITVAGLRPVVGASFAFADLPAACAHFAAGKHFGKVALTFGG
jgi:hypothetical protein